MYKVHYGACIYGLSEKLIAALTLGELVTVFRTDVLAIKHSGKLL